MLDQTASFVLAAAACYWESMRKLYLQPSYPAVPLPTLLGTVTTYWTCSQGLESYNNFYFVTQKHLKKLIYHHHCLLCLNLWTLMKRTFYTLSTQEYNVKTETASFLKYHNLLAYFNIPIKTFLLSYMWPLYGWHKGNSDKGTASIFTSVKEINN